MTTSLILGSQGFKEPRFQSVKVVQQQKFHGTVIGLKMCKVADPSSISARLTEESARPFPQAFCAFSCKLHGGLVGVNCSPRIAVVTCTWHYVVEEASLKRAWCVFRGIPLWLALMHFGDLVALLRRKRRWCQPAPFIGGHLRTKTLKCLWHLMLFAQLVHKVVF